MIPVKWKNFFSTTQGKLILLCCGILIPCWGFMLFQFSGDISAFFPNEARDKALKQEVRKLRAEVQERRAKAVAIDQLKKKYQDRLVTYWNEERDGLVDTVLRNNIQNAAKELELTLTALGSVRVTRINNELFFAEVDNLSAVAPYEVLVKFFAKLAEARPMIYWRRLDMRIEPVRQQKNSTSTILNSTPASIRMRFNGAVRVICYDGKKLPDKKTASPVNGNKSVPGAVPGEKKQQETQAVPVQGEGGKK